jgi:hypothetical protein
MHYEWPHSGVSAESTVNSVLNVALTYDTQKTLKRFFLDGSWPLRRCYLTEEMTFQQWTPYKANYYKSNMMELRQRTTLKQHNMPERIWIGGRVSGRANISHDARRAKKLQTNIGRRKRLLLLSSPWCIPTVRILNTIKTRSGIPENVWRWAMICHMQMNLFLAPVDRLPVWRQVRILRP